jgi:hypothetical protein
VIQTYSGYLLDRPARLARGGSDRSLMWTDLDGDDLPSHGVSRSSRRVRSFTGQLGQISMCPL